MRLRATLTADIELDDMKAFDRYRSVDAASVATSMQHQFQAAFEDDRPPEITSVQLVVTPVYG